MKCPPDDNAAVPKMTFVTFGGHFHWRAFD
jgi:hypothetical protein